MLPKSIIFKRKDLDKLLFAGIDLYEELESGEEKFVSIKRAFSKDGFYLISFSNDETGYDIIENNKINEFISKNIEIEIKDDSYPLMISGLTYNLLIEFLKLFLDEYVNIIG